MDGWSRTDRETDGRTEEEGRQGVRRMKEGGREEGMGG